MTKILITGYTGMLGLALVREFSLDYQLFGVALEAYPVKGIQDYALDLSQRNLTLKLIQKINPHLIIHTAAMTNVDQCEEDPREAYKVNVQATHNVVQGAQKTGAFLVYISTDFVFDGKRGNYKEEDLPNPENIYGSTKLKGEGEVAQIKQHLILRTTIYGWNLLHSSKLSLPEMVLQKLTQGEVFTPFQDQYFTPLYVGRLAEFIKRLYSEKTRGVVNATVDEKVSKYEFACLVAELWNLDKDLIRPISFREVNYKASRPVDASLNNNKLKRILGIDKISLKNDLERMKRDLKELKSLVGVL